MLILAAGTVWGARRGRPGTTATTVTAVLTALWTADAATDPPDVNDGLWPIGALLVFCGAATASTALAYLVDEVTAVRHRRMRGAARRSS